MTRLYIKSIKLIHNGLVYRANVVIKKELKDGPVIKKFFESIQLNPK